MTKLKCKKCGSTDWLVWTNDFTKGFSDKGETELFDTQYCLIDGTLTYMDTNYAQDEYPDEEFDPNAEEREDIYDIQCANWDGFPIDKQRDEIERLFREQVDALHTGRAKVLMRYLGIRETKQ